MNALGAFALILLAFGGYLNNTVAGLGGAPNLILVGAALCLALIGISVVRLQVKVVPILPLLLIALAFGYGIAAADTSSLYGEDKLQLLLTLSPLSFIAGAWLADSERSREWLAWGVTGLGLVAVVVQRMNPDEDYSAVGRLAGEDLSYQALSRAAAAGAVVLAVVSLSRRYKAAWRLACLVGAVGFAAVAIGGGSRGPMLGLLLAIAVVAFRTRIGVVIVAAFGVLAWYLLPTFLMPFIPSRLVSLDDSSSRVRADAAELTLLHIRENPLGTGFGSLEWVIAPAGTRNLYYPHNIVLEVAAEAGLIAAFVLVGVIVVVGYVLWRYGTSVVDDITLALLVYFVVNACVSGDINSNRGVWLFLGVASAAAHAVRRHAVAGQIEEESVPVRAFGRTENVARIRPYWR